ncbi:hypothetical protein NQ317_004260 [Molorchus minor]|uniref:Uncharacterized protein n=1 Tax=Molorchus minor TaxID=1323400 RepID=A0ABQ9K0G7_9CUCU|nr:hypothetical protein NQ317_004260 [Molorchus minor]
MPVTYLYLLGAVTCQRNALRCCFSASPGYRRRPLQRAAPAFYPLVPADLPHIRRNSLTSSRRSIVRRNSSKKRGVQAPALNATPVDRVGPPPSGKCTDSEGPSQRACVNDLGGFIPSNYISHDRFLSPAVMERSVDSIGTCSLDVEASANLPGRVAFIGAITPIPEPHLPSYLSLACTINGYSTTTNYDPIRLARSRDASPHRIDSDLTSNKPTYSIQNNLLSPPNLVPLPIRPQTKSFTPRKMGENTLTQQHHQDYYSSTKTISFITKDSHFTSKLFTAKDRIDGCLENGHHTVHSKCVSFESSKNITSVNGQVKCSSETSIKQELSNGKETKSFIQQRVERLYGPGALAQGFFVTKRQKSRCSESEDKNVTSDADKHSKSFTDKLLEDEDLEPTMKQSTSSPTLPVLRHLRPEFRAQLPIISPRKGVECSMQKSVTIPKLKDETKINGHSKVDDEVNVVHSNDSHNECVNEKISKKDGHYFLKIIEEQAHRLLELAARVESDISTPDLSEDVIGKLRSAAGKSQTSCVSEVAAV